MASMSLDPPPQPQPTTTQAAHHERTIHQRDHLHQRCRQALHSLLPPHPQPQLLPPTLMLELLDPCPTLPNLLCPCPTSPTHQCPWVTIPTDISNLPRATPRSSHPKVTLAKVRVILLSNNLHQATQAILHSQAPLASPSGGRFGEEWHLMLIFKLDSHS